MKTLSIKQPWLELMLQGRKDIEIRTWDTHYTGRLLLHASKRADVQACKGIGIQPYNFQNGVICGVGFLEKTICYNERTFRQDVKRHLNKPDWYDGHQYGWVFRDIHRIEPIKCNGHLSLWDYPGQLPPNKLGGL